MVDFVKFGLKNVAPSLITQLTESHDLLSFEGTYIVGEAVEGNKKIAEYRGMKVIIYQSGYMEIQGSLHKYKNDGLHNYDDFTFTDLQNVLYEISDLLEIDLKNCILKNIEFGVNITPPITTSRLLNGLISHWNTPFKNVHGGNYRQIKHQQYFVKAYDKGLQYNLTSPLFRFELKYRKMKEVNGIDLYTLKDLLKPNWIQPVKTLLLNSWEKVLYFDDTLLKTACAPLKLSQWSNLNYWQALDRKKRYKQREKYQEAVAKHASGIHAKIRNRIAEKWDTLSEQGGHINRLTETMKGDKLTVQL